MKVTKSTIEKFCQEHVISVDQFYGKVKIEGSLDLSGLTSIPKEFNPTVGGGLYLSGLTAEKKPLPSNYMFSWQNGKYIKVDGIFTGVISHKKNVYHVKKLGSEKIIYLVTDGERWSHGQTLREAKDDLIFKVSNRTREDYKDLKLKSILTFEEAIVCYRVITGACAFGTKDFVVHRLNGKKKEKYTVKEMIKVTEGEYGNNTFKDFFKR